MEYNYFLKSFSPNSVLLEPCFVNTDQLGILTAVQKGNHPQTSVVEKQILKMFKLLTLQILRRRQS